MIDSEGFKENLLVFDNKKKNRILLFCSDSRIKILSQSGTWHGDGTFHCSAKWFAQLYVIHAYFPAKAEFDETSDIPWVCLICIICIIY